MTRTLLSALTGAVLTCVPAAWAQTPIGLEFNGQQIVPAGGLDLFEYTHGEGTVKIESFFGDLRCMPDDQSSTDGLVLQLDRFSDLEMEAGYNIAIDGLVSLDLGSGMLSIQTSGGSPVANCTHLFPASGTLDAQGESSPGAFKRAGFERLTDLSFDTVATPDPNQTREEFTVTLRLINRSATTVLRNIRAVIGIALPEGQDLVGPDFGDQNVVEDPNEPGRWIWTIDLLYPQRGDKEVCDQGCAELDVSYASSAAGIQIPEDLEVKTAILDYDQESMGNRVLDRVGNPLSLDFPGELITVVNTSTISVVNTSTTFP